MFTVLRAMGHTFLLGPDDVVVRYATSAAPVSVHDKIVELCATLNAAHGHAA